MYIPHDASTRCGCSFWRCTLAFTANLPHSSTFPFHAARLPPTFPASPSYFTTTSAVVARVSRVCTRRAAQVATFSGLRVERAPAGPLATARIAISYTTRHNARFQKGGAGAAMPSRRDYTHRLPPGTCLPSQFSYGVTAYRLAPPFRSTPLFCTSAALAGLFVSLFVVVPHAHRLVHNDLRDAVQRSPQFLLKTYAYRLTRLTLSLHFLPSARATPTHAYRIGATPLPFARARLQNSCLPLIADADGTCGPWWFDLGRDATPW